MAYSIFKLSTEQEEAVDITRNIAVSAGAGSGKTRVLTNRYLRLLEDGIGIEEIVAITFTEKAALEMKERIRATINEKLEASIGADKKKWQEALDKLSRANISTIHSFCGEIIRENAARLGMDFKFKQINDIDKKLATNSAAEEALNKVVALGGYEDIIAKLANTFGEDYLRERLKRELLEISERISENGIKLEEVYIKLQKDELANFALKVILNIEEIYRDYKLNNDCLDYTDLEVLCKKVLEDDRVRDRYKERYKRFLVDEFQDTNEIQKSIIYSFVTDEKENLLPKKLFVVGDFKQSIYGFRGTDYTIFRKVAEAIGKEGQKFLSTCYRSKPEIIHGINEIFSRLIDQYENLKVPGDYELNENRLLLLTYPEEKNNDVSAVKKVKEAIGNKTINSEDFLVLLKELKDSYNKVQVNTSLKEEAVSKAVRVLFDKGLSAKDICILVRSKYIISDIEEELKKYNIPYCIIRGRGFYNKEEVKEILNLYELIINGFEEQLSIVFEKKLVKALRSFIFNISDDILYKIKIEQLENESLRNYFEAIEFVYNGMKDSEARDRLEAVYLTLLKLSKLRSKVSAVDILTAIINLCGIKETLLMQQGGIQRYRNIEKLLFEAEKFDNEKLFTPEEFIEYLNQLNDNNVDEAEASLDTEDTEAVKIMTIHQSKGLEFEGVIIPNVDSDQLRQSQKEDNKNNLVYHEGKIISKYDIKNPSKELTCEYGGYFESKLLKEVEESIRILYVALTRAKQYAVMVGEELQEELSEVLDANEKTSKLNSFIKQLLYPIKTGGASQNVLEVLDVSALSNMYKLENENAAEDKIDISNIMERLEFKIVDKPRSYVSASKYMKFKKCPRRFYIESVLNLKDANYAVMPNDAPEDYDETLETAAVEMLKKDEQAKENQIGYLKSAEIGIIVHKILEYKNSVIDGDDEVLIEKAIIEILGEDTANALEDRTAIKRKIKKYIENYEFIEKNREVSGELIGTKNEVSFIASPLEDRKTILTGFIDRLEIFHANGMNIAVITDYKTNYIDSEDTLNHLIEMYSAQLELYGKAIKDNLYAEERKIDEVHLKLYFLEKGVCIDVPYKEEEVEHLIRDMDKIFGRNLEALDIDAFPKADKQECEICNYREMCLE